MPTRTFLPPDEAEIKELLEERSKPIRAKSDVVKLVEPRIFELLRENISNVRNLLVVCVTLASVGLLVLDSASLDLPPLALVLLQVSVVCFIIDVLLYSLYLKHHISEGIKGYNKQKDGSVKVAKKWEGLVNKRIDGEISREDYEKQRIAVYKEIEYTLIRTRVEEDPQLKFDLNRHIGDIANHIFTAGLVMLVLSILTLLLDLNVPAQILMLFSKASI